MQSKLDTLKEEIDAKRTFNATLPDWGEEPPKCGWTEAARAKANEKAKHIKQLKEMEEKYELLRESQRIELAVRQHEELHPPITETCLICLDDVPLDTFSFKLFCACCGKGGCAECHKLIGTN